MQRNRSIVTADLPDNLALNQAYLLFIKSSIWDVNYTVTVDCSSRYLHVRIPSFLSSGILYAFLRTFTSLFICEFGWSVRWPDRTPRFGLRTGTDFLSSPTRPARHWRYPSRILSTVSFSTKQDVRSVNISSFLHTTNGNLSSPLPIRSPGIILFYLKTLFL